MEQLIVISNENAESILERLRAALSATPIDVANSEPEGPQELYFDGSSYDVDVPECTQPDGVEDYFDEDVHEIVQVRVGSYDPDYAPEGFSSLYAWADTMIDPLDIEEYRERYPEQEYRVVEVTDEIEFVDFSDESYDSQDTSEQEEEIGMLKAEILKLKAEIANSSSPYRNGNSQTDWEF